MGHAAAQHTHAVQVRLHTTAIPIFAAFSENTRERRTVGNAIRCLPASCYRERRFDAHIPSPTVAKTKYTAETLRV